MASNLLSALQSGKGPALQSQGTMQLGVMLLECAEAQNADGIVAALDNPKCKIDQKNSDGLSALQICAEAGNEACCKILVDKGARILGKDDLGENSFHKACKEGHTVIVEMLYDAYCDQMALKAKQVLRATIEEDSAAEKLRHGKRLLDAKDDEGVNALCKSVEKGQTEIVEWLLDHQCNAAAKDDEGWDAVMWGALTGQTKIIEGPKKGK